jgi:site-specific recombinase XerC
VFRWSGLSQKTLKVYGAWLKRFNTQAGDQADTLAVPRFFSGLRERSLSQSSIHQVYRSLKTFLRWTVEAETLLADPMKGFQTRIPRTLPQVEARCRPLVEAAARAERPSRRTSWRTGGAG